MDRETALARQRERRKENGNAATKKYEKTPRGFLMRAYRNMKSRIEGVQQIKFHLYQGKTLLSKDDFLDWAIDHPTFKVLFSEWVESEYNRKLTPSVDRIDSTKGYEIDNMEWVTHSVNSSRGSKSRQNKETA